MLTLYRMRWTNESGSEWFGDVAGYADLTDCEITAYEWFDADDATNDDVVRAWPVDEDGYVLGGQPAAEWRHDDFSGYR